MKDTTELIDLVEGRESGAEGDCVLSPETPALRELREAIDAVLIAWPLFSDSAKDELVRAMRRAAREAGL